MISEAVVSTVALSITAVACCERIRVLSKLDGHCEIWGYSVLLGGLVGAIGEWWMPHADLRAETIIAIGMALVSLSVLRPYVRGLLIALRRGRRGGVERRGAPRNHLAARFWRIE